MSPMPPGTQVSIVASASPNAIPSGIGTFFVVGQTSEGPVGTPVNVTSLLQYINTFGNRTDNSVTSTLYDTLDTFFQEGGQQAWVSRVFLASAVAGDTASLTLVDRAGSPLNTLKVSAIGPGLLGNNISVAVAVSGAKFIITITCPGQPTEVSPLLNTPADAVNWASAFSTLVTITNLNSVTAAPNNNPATKTVTALAGGVDNTSPADADWLTALATFISDLGVGQVAAPGAAGDQNVWTGLVNHALAFDRFALLDDSASQQALASTLEADATTIQSAATDPSYGYILTPNVFYPGLPTSTSTPPFLRPVPASGPTAGAMARLAAQGNNADVVCAGNNGFLQHAVGVAVRYSDTDRANLEAAGVCVIRDYRGNVQLYGATTLAVDPNWTDAGNARLRMQIADGVRTIGDNYAFADIDEQLHSATAFGGEIAAYLTQLYNQNALFGLTPADAFFVNVGAQVNTPVTAQARELLASVAVRMSPTADFVIIGVTKYPVSSTLPS